MPLSPKKEVTVPDRNSFEYEFVIAEYNSAWAIIISIDERRHLIAQIQVGIVSAVFAIIAIIIQNSTKLSVFICSIVTIVVFGAMLGNLICERILLSERKANIRYRKKVNLIRETILINSKNNQIKSYFNDHKELGIIGTSDPQPHGIGSTLGSILKILRVLQIILFITLIVVWIQFWYQ